MPRSNALGWRPKPRTVHENRKVTRMASRNPAVRANRPCRILVPWPWSMPSATLVMAPYSGPTTTAATIRIWELVRIPTAPMTPAMTR